ncbi:hypothetical protein GA0115252_11434 [Streptomyces sp. DfronAA-171]|nr:hypothetical protein GA0115252_11434 [Streptomyces sp. DfronAA-171]
MTIRSISSWSKRVSCAPTGACSLSYSVPGAVLRGGVRVDVEQVEAEEVRVGQAQHDAVVRVHDLRVEAQLLVQPRADRERPRRVHLRAEGGVHDDAPVAQLVAEALDDDGAVVGDVPAGAALLVQVREEVVRRPGVEPGRDEAQAGVLLGQAAQLPDEGAERAPQLQRPAELVALPERQSPRDPGRGRDEHAVARDVLDAPRRGAEREDVADARLVHHLLVQLADAPAALLRVRAGEEDAEEAAVGDRAA